MPLVSFLLTPVRNIKSARAIKHELKMPNGIALLSTHGLFSTELEDIKRAENLFLGLSSSHLKQKNAVVVLAATINVSIS